MDKRTYTIWGGYKSMCRIKFYLYQKFFFGGERVIWVFFYEKGSKGKKVLLQDM